MNLRKLALASLFTAVAGIPAMSQADSDLQVGPTAAAAVDLNFSIVIPRFVYFQVGSIGATVDTVQFDLAAGGVESGNGADVAATAGPVPVVLRSNASVTIQAQALASTGPLAPGSTEILLSSSSANIPLPAFGATSATVTGPINASGTWTFTYDNVGVYSAATYSDTVTYTAQTL
jgi:hypothetical protein